MAMPFDLTPAPQITTQFLQPAIWHLRWLGICCVVYIKDIILMVRSKAKSTCHTRIAVDLLHFPGWCPPRQDRGSLNLLAQVP